jgi:hypothetical protein
VLTWGFRGSCSVRSTVENYLTFDPGESLSLWGYGKQQMKHLSAGSSLMVVLRAEGERVEEFARIRHDGVPALAPASDPDAPTFTLRQCFVLNRIAEAHGTTALEMLGNCPPPPRTFLDRLGDLYEAMARGDNQHVASCLRALEAAADPRLVCVSG